MTLDGKPYVGWQLDGIGFDHQLFTVYLARYWMTAEEAADPSGSRFHARIIFIARQDVILSKVSSEAKLSEISEAAAGRVTKYILKFSDDSTIEVTAASVTELVR
jgi:hypothetical protein